MKRILLQGAMDIETNYFIEQIQKAEDYECLKENGMEFHLGTLGTNQYIVSVTGMGTVKASMATTYALSKFHPTLVVNQGTAGSQIRDLSTGDLVIAESAVNINAMKMPKKSIGEGSNPFSWEGFHTTYYHADASLVDFFEKQEYTSGRKRKGRAATGDLYSRESDRIIWLAEKYQTCCEEMETAAVYEICEAFATPCVGVRVISNNELLEEEFNGSTAEVLQKYVWKAVNENL